MFITFEGIEKSGKSTQAALLADALRDRGREVVLTREPGGTELGLAVRHLVLNQHYEAAVDATAEVLLFAADRAQHVAQVIRPALREGKVVISDRFSDSTLAYQGHGRGLDPALLAAVIRLATGGLQPDVTVLVDVDLKTSRARGWGTEPDRMERGDQAYFERVRNGFLEMSRQEPDRFRVYDGRQAPETVAAAILSDLSDRISD